MAPVPQRLRLTYEDYLTFPEDGKRHEVLDGEHWMTPSPNRRHQIVLGNLLWAVKSYLRQQDVGEVYSAPFDVVLSEFDVVQPDLLFVSRERLGILARAAVRGAPDLVVEVLSESTRRRDLVVKRKLYARHGVAEYWVVDPELEGVTVFRGAGVLAREAELSRGEGGALETPLLPGLSIPVAEICP